MFRKRVGNDVMLKHGRVGAERVEVENAHAAVCEYHKSDLKT